MSQIFSFEVLPRTIYNPKNGHQYYIEKPLGKGGFGNVYLGYDRQFDNRAVALKRLSKEGKKILSDEGKKVFGIEQNIFQELEKEARILEGLHHKRLPVIYDHFLDNTGSEYFIVMQYIPGMTVMDYVQTKEGYLSVEKVLYLGIQLTDVLHYLHVQEPPVIFRDLKPNNIMVNAKGEVYLIDFGLARRFKPGKTRDSHRFGCEGYIPPELLKGFAQTDEQSDIFSLGVVLHELLTGHNPLSYVYEFYYRTPFNAKQVVPQRLQNLIINMLQMSMKDRPRNMLDIKSELEQIQIQILNLQQNDYSKLQQVIQAKLDYILIYYNNKLGVNNAGSEIVEMIQKVPYQYFPFDYMERIILNNRTHPSNSLLRGLRETLLKRYLLQPRDAEKIAEIIRRRGKNLI